MYFYSLLEVYQQITLKSYMDYLQLSVIIYIHTRNVSFNWINQLQSTNQPTTAVAASGLQSELGPSSAVGCDGAGPTTTNSTIITKPRQ
jgi:hypothetical protein